MARVKKTDGTITVTGANGRIVDNVPAAALRGPSVRVAPMSPPVGQDETQYEEIYDVALSELTGAHTDSPVKREHLVRAANMLADHLTHQWACSTPEGYDASDYADIRECVQAWDFDGAYRRAADVMEAQWGEQRTVRNETVSQLIHHETGVDEETIHNTLTYLNDSYRDRVALSPNAFLSSAPQPGCFGNAFTYRAIVNTLQGMEQFDGSLLVQSAFDMDVVTAALGTGGDVRPLGEFPRRVLMSQKALRELRGIERFESKERSEQASAVIQLYYAQEVPRG